VKSQNLKVKNQIDSIGPADGADGRRIYQRDLRDLRGDDRPQMSEDSYNTSLRYLRNLREKINE
jgi:hypothetical protein